MIQKYRLSACLLIAVGFLPAAPVSFNAPRVYPIPGDPQSVAVGDFNGDGRPDVAVASLSGQVTVMLSDGAGGFKTAIVAATGHGLGSVIAVDLNGDGNLDLVVANNSVWVLLGNGDGAFQKAVSYAAGSAQAVAAGDFNGDGVLDLAAANYSSGTVSILLGKGDGTFLPAASYPAVSNAVSIVSADLNGDGHLDLAIASINDSGSKNIFLLFGNGDGTFQPMTVYPVRGGADYLAVGDFNGDGKPDLAASSGATAGATVAVLLGKGDGTFQPPVRYKVAYDANFVAAGDVNGDGKQDLVVTSAPLGSGSRGSDSVTVLLGNGDGTFQHGVEYLAGASPQAVGIGDFNGDGKADLAVADFSSGVTVLSGIGQGAFQQPVSFHVKDGASHTATGDFNGDGIPDLVTTGANINNGKGSLWLGNGDGTFQSPLTFPVGGGAGGMTVADFNGDGKADLAIANFYSGNVSVLLGNGNGTLQAAVNSRAGSFPASVAAADLNGDGILDLAVPNTSGAKSVSVLLGKGDGTFQVPRKSMASTKPTFTAIGDFNGDGIPDLAVTNQGPFRSNKPRKVSILLGKGDGTYLSPVNYKVAGYPAWLAVADLNGDGKLDVVVAGGTSRKSSILWGHGDGTFRVATQHFGSGANWVGTADFDGDGNLDIAMVSATGVVSIVPGNGAGGFGQPVAFSAGISGHTAVVIPFNGGNPSLVVATGQGVAVLTNTTR
jgi:hypothetical protein